MTEFQVAEPILNSPYDEPREHWWIIEGLPLERRQGRRPAMYYYVEPGRNQAERGGFHIELKRVNLIRERVKAWRQEGWPGVTRTTRDLLTYWRREGREKRLFFAQLEAAETILFLAEARADFRQGVEIPRDEPTEEARAKGYAGFLRYACKMATGAGKTTVMGLLAAWSLLNKAANPGDRRFSDVVLVVCPNVTIRDRLKELDPEQGEASLYRTRDLVPGHLLPHLAQGKVLVTNWHVFEPQAPQTAGDGGRVVRAGVPVVTTETIRLGEKNETKRGSRWVTRETLGLQIANGLVEVVEGDPARDPVVKVRSTRYVESDTALVNRVLRDVGGKRNLLVFNDEAHHAYRVKVERPEDWEELDEDEREEWLSDKTEATVWIDGLDRVAKLRGINVCIDLSATPYFLNRVGQEANRPFPWVVSDFGLIDAIESGLVKIPQLAVRDTTGAEVPGYFNIWQWILQPGRLTASERGGKRAHPKPEAVLKWAHHPIAMLGGLWEETRREWLTLRGEERPPVFILVCKNTALANVIFEWLANGRCPVGIPPSKLDGFRNTPAETNTIVVHSKVVEETDRDLAGGGSQADEKRWMRFTLDTVGRRDWPRDRQGRELTPDGFADLAKKLDRPLHPPGRDVRCIVSVGMLTEGWDCQTVTHIVGLRPFQSQLLCEQVVGRGLRRSSYEVGENGRLTEEVAKVFGVPFQIVPFKANPAGAPPPTVKRHHVRGLPERAHLGIEFPRVEGYVQAVRNRVTVDWSGVPPVTLEPGRIPPEVEAKGLHPTNTGRLSLSGPGKADALTLEAFRRARREQELVFDVAGALTRLFREQRECQVPPHVLFPQLAAIVRRYLDEKVEAPAPSDKRDVFLSPYYGWLVEALLQNLRGDVEEGEAPELPLLETSRGPGSTAEVDFWTSRDAREVTKSQVNYVVADTKRWEQSAAYYLDTHPAVAAFVKNAGLGLGIPYLHNGEQHEYVPDFVLRLAVEEGRYLLLETKGYDPLKEVKKAAAERWCAAVNARGGFGRWAYTVVDKPEKIPGVLSAAAKG
ncbi:MAG: DEAD/DEAH box helicase family protein [Deltaproteobacteria bacterium]|nr:DEAD/DEAH box helicase family protein [Deltaproteobacteria bacterium]